MLTRYLRVTRLKRKKGQKSYLVIVNIMEFLRKLIELKVEEKSLSFEAINFQFFYFKIISIIDDRMMQQFRNEYPRISFNPERKGVNPFSLTNFPRIA